MSRHLKYRALPDSLGGASLPHRFDRPSFDSPHPRRPAMFSFLRSKKNARRSTRSTRKNNSRGLRLEPLERRELMATVPVTLNIHDFQQLAFPDDDGDGDYYAEVTIGNNPEQSTRNLKH